MKFAIELDSLEATQVYVSEFCEENDIDPKTSTRACVCCDEIISNVIQYSGSTFGEIQLFVDEDKKLVIKVSDDGKAFNPLEEAKTPDISCPVEEREIGGLGVFMVKKMAQSVVYERKDNLNILTIKM